MKLQVPTSNAWSLVRCRRGANAVEFALIAPLLVTFVLGITQVGIIFLNLYQMNNAVSDVGRQLALGSIEITRVESILDETLNGASAGSTESSSSTETPTDTSTEPAPDVTATNDKFEVSVSQSGDTVKLEVKLPWGKFAFLDILGLFKDADLKVSNFVKIK